MAAMTFEPRESQPTDAHGLNKEVALFEGLVVSNPSRGHKKPVGWWGFSVASHGLVLVLVVLLPILLPSNAPEAPDYIRALIYNPPPPPPPPLPKGSALVEQKTRPERVKPKTEEKRPEKIEEPKLTAEFQVPAEIDELLPEDLPDESEQFGSETGSDFGLLEGMEEGVEGGVIGGVPGGVIGGVIGGTGDGPVMDYDRPPKPIKITRPRYPQDAFVKKIEGTVIVEILIDRTGHVTAARVIQSIPALDQAAVATVKQWVFSPAVKNGRPVPTLAHAPVAFRIY